MGVKDIVDFDVLVQALQGIWYELEQVVIGVSAGI